MPLIKPNATEAIYTRSLSQIAQCIHTQSRCTPQLIQPNAIEANYTRLLSHSTQGRHTQGICTPLLIEPSVQSLTTPGKFHMWKNADISRADVPNRKSYICCSYLQNTSIMLDQESRQPPQKHISWFSSQVMQITYTTLYTHLALLFSDSSHLCTYIISPHILAPNICKCYQGYF